MSSFLVSINRPSNYCLVVVLLEDIPGFDTSKLGFGRELNFMPTDVGHCNKAIRALGGLRKMTNSRLLLLRKT